MLEILHATLIARRVEGRWAGVLVRGVSSAGKSTLALQALEAGWVLIADDRVVTWPSGGMVFGRAPAPLAGLVEVRGVGVVVERRTRPMAPVALVVDLIFRTPEAELERMPGAATVELCGMDIPSLVLTSADPNAHLRLSAALAASQHRL